MKETWTTKWYALVLLAALMLIATACTSKEEPENEGAQDEKVLQWETKPDMQIDSTQTYTADVETNKGTFTIELFAKEAPITVNNFVFLSKEGYYENVPFHRIMETFMIQTGDPTGTGRGGPGYIFEDELDTPYTYEPGIVAMANAGPDTNGSQFFIGTGDQVENLNFSPNYTIFGRISDGMDAIEAIAQTPVTQNAQGELSKPQEEVTILKITINEQ